MNKTKAIDLFEITALLALPMLSSRISIFYIILAMIIILASRYLRKEKWTSYGFRTIELKKTLLAAIVGFGFAAIGNYFIEPLVTKLTGETADLSSFSDVKGNVSGFFGLLAMGWVIGGLFEEFLFRGYLLNRINLTINNQALSKWIGIVVTSISFAVAHGYQGAGGIINTFYFSFILALLYYYFKKNVWYVIIVHGCFDTFGIIYLYLGL